jgi:hypothetical protein
MAVTKELRVYRRVGLFRSYLTNAKLYNAGHIEAAYWPGRGRLYESRKGVICRPSRIDLILMMIARGRMPATKGRVLMVVRDRFYDDRVGIICLMSDRKKVACLQVYRAFDIDVGHEGIVCLMTEKRSF